jgi:hypothetical protein
MPFAFPSELAFTFAGILKRASCGYELLVLTLDVLAECFEQRDAAWFS